MTRFGAWHRRWLNFRAAGITYEQARMVFELLDETGAFGSRTLAEIAASKLELAYDRQPLPEGKETRRAGR